MVVFLDNLDSLSPGNQRYLVDVVLAASHRRGPTFVLATRTETFRRHSLGDRMLDQVTHTGPRPFTVVLNRLQRVFSFPDHEALAGMGLARDDLPLAELFLRRTAQRIGADPSDPFRVFIDAAAGDSIRQALLLSQGLLQLTSDEMASEALSSHNLVRACIAANLSSVADNAGCVANLFDCSGLDSGRFLAKLLLLQFVRNAGSSASVPSVRNYFVQLGYDDNDVRLVIESLVSHHCQLLYADGFDVHRQTWGEEQESLYLTAIGDGYLDHVCQAADYITEVMRYCRVDSARWRPGLRLDNALQRLDVARDFIADIWAMEQATVLGFIDQHNLDQFHKLYGPVMITPRLLSGLHQSVRLIAGKMATRHPELAVEFGALVARYDSLVGKVTAESERATGVRLA